MSELTNEQNQATVDLSPWTDNEMDLLAAEDADALGWDQIEDVTTP